MNDVLTWIFQTETPLVSMMWLFLTRRILYRRQGVLFWPMKHKLRKIVKE